VGQVGVVIEELRVGRSLNAGSAPSAAACATVTQAMRTIRAAPSGNLAVRDPAPGPRPQ
jgi:hypothetical protein